MAAKNFNNGQQALDVRNIINSGTQINSQFSLASISVDADYSLDLAAYYEVTPQSKISIQFPSAVVPASNARLSLDNGVTYYNIQDSDFIQLIGSDVQSGYHTLTYNGTVWIRVSSGVDSEVERSTPQTDIASIISLGTDAKDGMVNAKFGGLTVKSETNNLISGIYTSSDNEEVYLLANGLVGSPGSIQRYTEYSGNKMFYYINIPASATEFDVIQTAGGVRTSVPSGTEVWLTLTAPSDTALAYISITANGGGVISMDDCSIFAIDMTALGIESYTEAQILDVARSMSAGTDLQDAIVNAKTVGKNLFDLSTSTLGFVYSNLSNESSTVADSTGNISDYIQVKEGETYYVSGSIGASVNHYFDSDKVWVEGFALVDGQITIPSGVSFMRLSNRGLMTMQVEQNTVATDYEPYRAMEIPLEFSVLRSVPNGEQDILYNELDDKGLNKWIHEKNIKEYFLESADFVALTTGTNNQWVRFTVQEDDIYFGSGSPTLTTGRVVEGFTSENGVLSADDVENAGKMIYSTTSQFNLVFAGTTNFTDIADARTQLEGTKMLYQLETPTITEYLNLPYLASFDNGTLYQEGLIPSLEWSVPTNLSAEVEDLHRIVGSLQSQIGSGYTGVREGKNIEAITGNTIVDMEGLEPGSYELVLSGQFMTTGSGLIYIKPKDVAFDGSLVYGSNITGFENIFFPVGTTTIPNILKNTKFDIQIGVNNFYITQEYYDTESVSGNGRSMASSSNINGDGKKLIFQNGNSGSFVDYKLIKKG